VVRAQKSQKHDFSGVANRLNANRRTSAGVVELEDDGMNWHHYLLTLIQSTTFDYCTLVLIFLNAITMGLQVDYMARNNTDKSPTWIRVIEVFCCCAFTIELILRIIVFGRFFLQTEDWAWNVFDTLVVLLQVVEEILTAMASSFRMNFSFLRVVRIFRLVRVIRLIRLLRLIGELRTLVASLAGSLKSFGWTIFLLFGMVYTASIFFTQLVVDNELGKDASELPNEVLRDYFGSLGYSILTLVQSIMGGVSWREVSSPLMDELHWAMALVFCAYITFCVLAIMNVVTGVFVDSALKSAKNDRDIYLINTVRTMFRHMGLDLVSELTWSQFESALDSREMVEYFKAIDIDISEAEGIFQLLDMNNSGALSAGEFLSGCMRLQGPAKALDLIVLMHEVQDMGLRQEYFTERVLGHLGIEDE
jgi:voltage-gated sodium channel